MLFPLSRMLFHLLAASSPSGFPSEDTCTVEAFSWPPYLTLQLLRLSAPCPPPSFIFPEHLSFNLTCYVSFIFSSSFVYYLFGLFRMHVTFGRTFCPSGLLQNSQQGKQYQEHDEQIIIDIKLIGRGSYGPASAGNDRIWFVFKMIILPPLERMKCRVELDLKHQLRSKSSSSGKRQGLLRPSRWP